MVNFIGQISSANDSPTRPMIKHTDALKVPIGGNKVCSIRDSSMNMWRLHSLASREVALKPHSIGVVLIDEGPVSANPQLPGTFFYRFENILSM